ncbi:IclR family transcriptional regulator [Halobellus limi]|jgi:DNA-binding IclR family transcriptional regulator|uniref:IclR family transcriptional regulator n=1 Tax=Halobellus limi TaxID=699433 RepID=A0A1H6AFV8_9EURY|nr:IclR family transcriptional regulator [Halobellus limi]QCC47576.1 IclR family transcriptional regulator [Halobellus limi]SEG47653.1 transcriptional regulator, IclR family [Halobellus limi]
MEQPGQKPNTPVKTAQTTFRIVETLKSLDGATVTELADRLDIAKSSAHNYLRTLEHEGYVVERNGEYEVGLRFLDLGGYARSRERLYDIAIPEMERVAEATGEYANLLVEEHGLGVFLARERGADAVSLDSYTGQSVRLHTTALGKTILAYLPRERVEAIIDRHGLPAMTERTITERNELFDALEEIRQRECAYDREERIKGLNCVAVPILYDDDIAGALSVSGPVSRMGHDRIEDEVLPELRRAANIIELNQAHS